MADTRYHEKQTVALVPLATTNSVSAIYSAFLEIGRNL